MFGILSCRYGFTATNLLWNILLLSFEKDNSFVVAQPAWMSEMLRIIPLRLT